MGQRRKRYQEEKKGGTPTFVKNEVYSLVLLLYSPLELLGNMACALVPTYLVKRNFSKEPCIFIIHI